MVTCFRWTARESREPNEAGAEASGRARLSPKASSAHSSKCAQPWTRLGRQSPRVLGECLSPRRSRRARVLPSCRPNTRAARTRKFGYPRTGVAQCFLDLADADSSEGQGMKLYGLAILAAVLVAGCFGPAGEGTASGSSGSGATAGSSTGSSNSSGSGSTTGRACAADGGTPCGSKSCGPGQVCWVLYAGTGGGSSGGGTYTCVDASTASCSNCGCGCQDQGCTLLCECP